MSYYDVAIGGVTDDGTSYLQVGRNFWLKLRFSRLPLHVHPEETHYINSEILANESTYFEV